MPLLDVIGSANSGATPKNFNGGTMRRIVLAIAGAFALIAAGALVGDRAEAMTVSTPAGIAAAVQSNSLAQDVAYFCRRVWRCGPYGCGWRRVCSWTAPGPYYGYAPYYGHRPYWRHRYYRRHYW
jgi:hypothetical protein